MTKSIALIAALSATIVVSALCLSRAHGATVWTNPQHPDRVLDTEMQLCREQAWAKLPNGESEEHMLVDTIFGTGFCLTQRGWVLVSYLPSKQ